MQQDLQPGAPEFAPLTIDLLKQALRLGWADLRAAPAYGLVVGLTCALAGWVFAGIAWASGQTYWLIFAVTGFPLVGAFAATALYEVSRRRAEGLPIEGAAIFGVMWQQRGRQLPWLGAIIVVAFLFWFFLAHMIFALFLGLSTMTNVSSSYGVLLTGNGLMMLGFGSVVGGIFACVIYMLSVLALPMLLDREVDFVTAMLSSFQAVSENRAVMIGWGVVVSAAVFLAMLPGFLGLVLIMPVLGHASWHVYALAKMPR